MAKISDDCVVLDTSGVYDLRVGYRCKKCEMITTNPRPTSIDGWEGRGNGDEIYLYCPKCRR